MSSILSPTIEDIITRARQQGVQRDDHLPFLMTPAQPNGCGVLLVHGFTASPRELQPLGRMLAEAGFLVKGVRLPGHGTSPEDLAKRQQEEWQQAVKEGFLLLHKQVERIYAVGLSTGALLVLHLAKELPLVGLVLLSPFLRVRHRLAPAAGLLRFIVKYQNRPLAAHLIEHYYERRPVHGVHQLNRLCRAVRKDLSRINMPVLMVNGEGDRTIRVDSSLDLFRRLASPHKVFHLYGPEVGHVLTGLENPRRQEIFDLIRNTLAFWESRSPDRFEGEPSTP
jgi:carboxylesterase